VILSPLQRLVFGRPREPPAQLVGVALLGNAFPEASLNAQREPQRLRGWGDELVVARDELARLLDAALAITDRAELEKRRGLVRVELEGALEEVLRVLGVVQAQAAKASGRIRAPGGGIQRVFHRLHEIAQPVLFASVLAQEVAVVVVDLRIVRRQTQRPLVALLRERGLAQLRIYEPEETVGRRIG